MIAILQLDEKAKRCRELQDERSSWEDRVRMLDGQRHELELRLNKAQDILDGERSQLNKQVSKTCKERESE